EKAPSIEIGSLDIPGDSGSEDPGPGFPKRRAQAGRLVAGVVQGGPHCTKTAPTRTLESGVSSARDARPSAPLAPSPPADRLSPATRRRDSLGQGARPGTAALDRPQGHDAGSVFLGLPNLRAL